MIDNCNDIEVHSGLSFSKNAISPNKSAIITNSKNVACYVTGDKKALSEVDDALTNFVTNAACTFATPINSTFKRACSLTNLYKHPLMDNINEWSRTVTQDTTGKVYGAYSLKLVGKEDDENIYVSSLFTGLKEGDIYLVALPINVESITNDSKSRLHMLLRSSSTDVSSVFNKYMTAENTQGKQLLMGVAKVTNTGNLYVDVNMQDANGVVYIGNVLCCKLSDNLLYSNINKDTYPKLYELLNNNKDTELGKLVYNEDVSVKNIMDMLEILHNGVKIS